MVMPQKPLQDVQEEPTADVVVAGWKIGGMEGREVLKDGKKSLCAGENEQISI